MSSKPKKAKKWEDIDDETQLKLIELRKKEKEYKDKSGYNLWLKYFAGGTITYSIIFYNLYFKKKPEFSFKNGFLLFAPVVIYGFTLMSLLYDKEAFQNYYKTHIELNRVIKKTSQSSEYK
jgi:hypothetical protein